MLANLTKGKSIEGQAFLAKPKEGSRRLPKCYLILTNQSLTSPLSLRQNHIFIWHYIIMFATDAAGHQDLSETRNGIALFVVIV